MIAALLVGPGDVTVGEVQEPMTPDDGLLLRVVACGVCGSDVRRWREGPPEGSGGVTPGHEVAGIVEAVGPDCTRWRAGDRLALAPDVHCGRCWYCRHGRYNLCDDLRLVGITPGYPGGMAERMALTGEILHNGIVHEMPPGMGYVEATLAEPASSVVACHDGAGTTLGDTVLVMGAGPIGCLHAVVAAARGARVIISEPNPDRRGLAGSLDPVAVLDPAAEDVVARVRDLTGGLGADTAICANPVAATQAQAVEAVRKAGRVVLFGGLPGGDPTTTLDANRIHYGEIEVVGAFSYHPTAHSKALQLVHRGVIPA
ncbi:MAG: alcohol dehydrogenase catalytic domain-containing protein, partial [Candidatus Brocadiaceae bacterium]